MNQVTMLQSNDPNELPNTGYQRGCYKVISNEVLKEFDFDEYKQRQAYRKFLEFWTLQKNKDILYCQFRAQ
jgi:hypothetical protein